MYVNAKAELVTLAPGLRLTPGMALRHRVITHRDVTDVPTFFVRMLGKLLEFTGIEYAIQDGGSPFKLAEHIEL